MTDSKQKFFILLAFLSFSIFTVLAPLTQATAQSAKNVNEIIKGLENVAKDAKIVTEEKAAPTIYDFLGRFINFFLAFIGAIFLIIIIYAGFTWMMAKGNQQEIEKAKKLLENATIGLIIIMIAYLLTNFVVFRIIGISTPTGAPVMPE